MYQIRTGKRWITRLKNVCFLGISESSKAYKLFNLVTKKVVVSRDVSFEEENTWDWNV